MVIIRKCSSQTSADEVFSMHIPDGYLSPATCAAMYASSAPFWYVALLRLQRQLTTRLVPLLSVFAAFSFLVMMINLPLPGGTTGHATGVGIAAIALGPWVSILAISMALLIQAFFFGDGGITTLGANCFNMAIVGSLVAYVVYRILAARSSIVSPRRAVAAALAGYTAINISAFCAAIELGIQPLLSKGPSGTPLYAPYPLGIAIPVMMIGHLTFAGLAELVLTGGVVAYFQRTNPSLLKLTAGAVQDGDPTRQVAGWRASSSMLPVWTTLALLLALTPLGVLAGGAAWGEWGARDFSDATARRRIAAVSRNVPPPTQVPQGLERLSSVWTAPFPQYAPSFVRRPALGYALSAMFGAGIILLGSLIVRTLFLHADRQREKYTRDS